MGATTHPPRTGTTLEPPDCSPEQIQAALQAVLQSSVFERSEKLQRFLKFICELTLRGDSAKINEYLIGSEVFLRGPEYSPSEDSVVRRQAHTLRHKLQEYYAGEGSADPVRIELPVGRYVPVFRRVKEVPSAPAETGPTELVPPASNEAAIVVARPPAWRSGLLALAIGAALCVPAGAYLAGARSAEPPAVPQVGRATREIWGAWQQPGHQVIICFSSPMTAVIKRFDAPLPPDTQPKRFRALPQDEAIFRRSFDVPPGGAFYFTPALNQTKLGEAVAGVHLSALMTRLQMPVQTTQSRFVSWEDLRGDDMILLGNNEANQWLDPLLAKAPMQLRPSVGNRQRAITVKDPRPGELPEYIINYAVEERDGDQEYALISMLPGMSANQRLLLISGLNSQATQAATEFLTTEHSLAELYARLHEQAPQHRGPWYFQAIVKCEVHDNVPTKVWLQAIRVIG